MKTLLHVPIEQYGFLSLEYDNNEELTDEAIKTAVGSYNRVSRACIPAPVNSLPDKEFNAVIDEYLTKKTITNGQEAYEKMSPKQQDIIQAIKRSYARLKK